MSKLNLYLLYFGKVVQHVPFISNIDSAEGSQPFLSNKILKIATDLMKKQNSTQLSHQLVPLQNGIMPESQTAYDNHETNGHCMSSNDFCEPLSSSHIPEDADATLSEAENSIIMNDLRQSVQDMIANHVPNPDHIALNGSTNESINEGSFLNNSEVNKSTPIRRPRGRPRKDGLPAGSLKKIKISPTPEKPKESAKKRRFIVPGVVTKSSKVSPEIKTPKLVKKIKKIKKFETPEDKTNFWDIFDENTRMSSDTPKTKTEAKYLTNFKPEDTQSTISSCSNSVDCSLSEKKPKTKMKLITEIKVDMIAEYDWPPPKGCCPAKNRERCMIQEQIVLFLGIKSFKRKYPDIPRRQIGIDERKWLQERGMVTEEMCDLGITALLAADVLDIMQNDFFEKYEEYKAYLREKSFRGSKMKQKAMETQLVDKSVQTRGLAVKSAAKWNCKLNKDRKRGRHRCLDLQTYIMHVPYKEKYILRQPKESTSSNYPISIVPGQFVEDYISYTPEEIRHFPINTIIGPSRRRSYYDEDSDSSSSSSSGSSGDSSSSDCSDSCSQCTDSDSSISSTEDECETSKMFFNQRLYNLNKTPQG